MLRSWPLYLRLQAGALEDVTHATGTGDQGSLVFGPGPEEAHRLRLTYTGPFTSASLPDVDMHETPYPNGAFSQVFSSNVLEHSFAPYVAMMEMRRILVAGGKAHVAMPWFQGPDGGRGPLHLHCLDEQVWAEMIRKVGFRVDEYVSEQGHFEPTAGYHVFHLTAGAPDAPHDLLLANLSRWFDDGRPPLNP